MCNPSKCVFAVTNSFQNLLLLKKKLSFDYSCIVSSTKTEIISPRSYDSFWWTTSWSYRENISEMEHQKNLKRIYGSESILMDCTFSVLYELHHSQANGRDIVS